MSKNDNKDAFQVWFDKDKNFLRLRATENLDEGEIGEDVVKKIKKKVVSLSQKNNIDLCIVDMSGVTKISSEARKILAKPVKSLKVKKIAFLGSSTRVSVILDFIIGFSETIKIKHFSKEKKAMDWLMLK